MINDIPFPTYKAACVQNCAGKELTQNLATLGNLIDEAVDKGADLIATAEYCSQLGMKDGKLDVSAQKEEQHKALSYFIDKARSVQKWILIGSLSISLENGRVANRSYLIDPTGSVKARYDKIHMFDVDLEGGESYRESDTIFPGSEAVIVDLPWQKMGMSICYDLRFPDLYRTYAKAGAELLVTPAAFTRKTGKTHWHILNQARAIENGCFVIAPCQCGEAEDGSLARYGHSLIIAPWGEILAEGGEGEGVIVADIDTSLVSKARSMVPSLKNDRPFTVSDCKEAALDAAE